MYFSKIVYKKTDEWYIEWQRVAQWVTASGTTRDNERQREATSDKQVVVLAKFLFSRIREEPTTMHPKETL